MNTNPDTETPTLRRVPHRVARALLGSLALTTLGGALAYTFVSPDTWTMWAQQAGFKATGLLIPDTVPTGLADSSFIARVNGFRAVLEVQPPLAPSARQVVVSGMDVLCMDGFIATGSTYASTETLEQRKQTSVTLHWPDGTAQTVRAGDRGALRMTHFRTAVPDSVAPPGAPKQNLTPWSPSCTTHVGLDAVPADLSQWKTVHVRAGAPATQ